MAAHSPVGASGMSRWQNCPGSVKLSEGLESPSSEHAALGTAAHELAELCLVNREDAAEHLGRVFEVAGFTFTVDREMADAVQAYLDVVRGLLDDREGTELLVEHWFQLRQVSEKAFGTADAIVWDPGERTLHVLDYKHGAGVPVEVRDNPQPPYYALGAMLELKYPARRVVMHIVQPRCPHPDGPHRSVEATALDMLDFASELRDAIEATEAPDAPLRAGSWCRWCPAAGKPCPKLKEEAQRMAKQEFREGLSYDPEELAETLDFLPVLEAWAKSVREFAYAQAEHGHPVPRHKIVEKRPTRKWRDEDAAKRMLLLEGLKTGDIYQPPKLLTPAQMEKLLGKERKGIMDDLVMSESSGHVLVPESDKRPAVKLSAAEEFGIAE